MYYLLILVSSKADSGVLLGEGFYLFWDKFNLSENQRETDRQTEVGDQDVDTGRALHPVVYTPEG